VKTTVPGENHSTQWKPQYPVKTTVPGENHSTRWKPCLIATFSTMNPNWPALGLKLSQTRWLAT